MLLIFPLYFLTFYIVLKIKSKCNLSYKHFPKMQIKKDRIVFYSFCRHRLNLFNFKFLQNGKNVYLKNGKSFVVVSNVDRVFKNKNNLYFTGLGKVEIKFDFSGIYKYFNLEITSKKFSLEELKQQAVLDILNNGFQLNLCKTIKRYIEIIKNVLNVHVQDKKLVVRQNRLKLPFVLKYKINNRIRCVIVNETLEEKP